VSDTPRRDFAARPQVLTPSSTPTAGAPSASAQASRGSASSPGTPGATPSTSPSPGTRPSAASSSYRVVGVLEDRSGDQGLDGPAYADLLSVQLADDGTRLRVTVTMGGALPLQPASRESLGIGVDLYQRTTQTESSYQLFADGGPDGWYAYLQTPRGFVRYPGTFALAGARLVFTVPWSSVGSPSRGAFSSFADWTQGGRAGTLGGNANSHDEAPALGNRSWSR